MEPEKPEDILGRAEKTKETGNTLFKAGKYAEAITMYTKAIGTPRLSPLICTG